MSLTVSDDLLARAELGDVEEAEFVDCIRTSLPYAWETISRVATAAKTEGFADNQTPPPSEEARGQLLRALASDAMRDALERHFAVKLAFQNCHRVAAFVNEEDRYKRFVSPRAQLLNQSPEFRDC